MKLKALVPLVEKSDRGKEDVAVKSSDLRVTESGDLVFEGREFTPSDWGWYTLLNKSSKGTTKRYLFRHPTPQWVEMVNYDLAHSSQDWVLRTRGEEILGVVSRNYRKFDNRQVVEALISNLGGETPIHRYHLDDRFFYVRALYPDGDFRIEEETEGDYHIGFSTFNSEVGFRSLGIAAFLFKQSCQNDAQMAPHTRMVFRHVGHSSQDMRLGLRASIDAGIRLKDYYQDLVREASRELIREEAVKPVLGSVKKLLRLSKKRTDAIAELYAGEPQTKMGIVNAITHFAHRLRGTDRYLLESGAGALLERPILGGKVIPGYAA